MASSFDVFQDDSPVMVDCDILEAAKENVQPLAAGRRVTALSSILSTPHALRESKLAATRNRLRINVELALEDDDDDPLEAYCRLIYWIVENYPEGNSAESGLLEVLEEATRVLKDDRDGKWRGEIKYLKVWLLYASFVEKPTTIYRFLMANDIGTDLALLYEEYAAVLERDGRRKEADDVYVLGIARRASPIDHLKSRHADFQIRMMCAAPVPAPPTAASSSLTSQRAVLSTTSGGVTALPSSSRGPTHTRIPSSNAPLQVFVDPSGPDAQFAELQMNAWPDVGTRKTRIKENVPDAKKLAGTTLRQAGKSKRVASGSGGASSSKIVPYRDPEPGDMPPPPVPASKNRQRSVSSTPSKGSFVPFVDDKEATGAATSATPAVPATPKFTPFRDEDAIVTSPSGPAPESVMKAKKVDPKSQIASTEAEALRKDPLKNYGLGVADVGDI